jgi:hypothetical protein
MNCPECGFSDYFYGFMGHNCLNAKCRHYKNGSITLSATTPKNSASKYVANSINTIDTVSGVKVSRVRNLYEYIKFDRGAAYDGVADNVLIKGTIVNIVYDHTNKTNLLDWYEIYIEEDFSTSDNFFVARGTKWSVWPHDVYDI